MILETIGRYEVQCLLGEGAFGQVYAAFDPVLARAVAIKVLRDSYSTDASFMERFRAEATSLASLSHHNITPVYDLLQSGAQQGMVMELVRGHTLEHVLKRKRRLSLEETLAVVQQAAAGLGYVHRQDVVHRDIKPSNIMLTATGVLKIMDFGIARVQGAARLTRDGSVLGTLAFAAPEQIRGAETEPRSDQYSLACVVYEMLCGQPPFNASTEYELMTAHMSKVPDPCSEHVPEIPQEVDRAILRALSKQPTDRFASVDEFGRALGVDAISLRAVDIVKDLVASTDPIPAIPQTARSSSLKRPSVAPTPVTPAKQRPSAVKRNTPLLFMGAAAAVALGVAGFILVDSGMHVYLPVQLNTAHADIPQIALPPPPTAPPAPDWKDARPTVPDAGRPVDTFPTPPANPPATAQPPVKPVEKATPTPSEAAKPRSNDEDNGSARLRPAIKAEPELPKIQDKPSPKPADKAEAAPEKPAEKSPETQPERPPEKQAERPPEKQAERPPEKQAERLPEKQAERPPEKQAERPPEKQAEKLPEKQAEKPPAKPSEKPPEEIGKLALVAPPSPPPPARVPMPTGPPNYQGRIVAWLSSTTIRGRSATGGGFESLKIFGIREKVVTKQKDADALRDQLEKFLKEVGTEATCWNRYSPEFKEARSHCFVDKQDMALWAIENNLGQASADAPAHYPRTPR